MARKSAISKGYRKTAAKKPYLTRRDIIILCAMLAIVAVGAILLFSYDDGALKTRDGKIVDAGENWLVVNGATGNGRRYFKLAEVSELAGYSLEIEPMSIDENLRLFRYSPEDEASAVRSITVFCNAASAERQAQYYSALLTEFSPSEPATGTAGDLTYTCFTYNNEALVNGSEADDAEHDDAGDEGSSGAESAQYEKGFNLYADAPEHGAVSVSVVSQADSFDALPGEDALRDIALQALSAIQFEAKR